MLLPTILALCWGLRANWIGYTFHILPAKRCGEEAEDLSHETRHARWSNPDYNFVNYSWFQTFYRKSVENYYQRIGCDTFGIGELADDLNEPRPPSPTKVAKDHLWHLLQWEAYVHTLGSFRCGIDLRWNRDFLKLHHRAQQWYNEWRYVESDVRNFGSLYDRHDNALARCLSPDAPSDSQVRQSAWGGH